MISTFSKFAGAILGLTFGIIVSGLAVWTSYEAAWYAHNLIHPPLTNAERMLRLMENAPICTQGDLNATD